MKKIEGKFQNFEISTSWPGLSPFDVTAHRTGHAGVAGRLRNRMAGADDFHYGFGSPPEPKIELRQTFVVLASFDLPW